MKNLSLIIPIFGLLALAYTFWKSAWVAKQDAGTDEMKRIADAIADHSRLMPKFICSVADSRHTMHDPLSGLRCVTVPAIWQLSHSGCE